MVKIVDLQKRRDRVEKELLKAEAAYEKQKNIIQRKKALLEQIDMEIVTQLLVENHMNMKDLMAMLSNETSGEPEKSMETEFGEGTVTEGIKALDLGGEADEI